MLSKKQRKALKETRERYQIISEEEKKKCQYHHDQNKNLSNKEKIKKVEKLLLNT